jgi:hypothetical protein
MKQVRLEEKTSISKHKCTLYKATPSVISILIIHGSSLDLFKEFIKSYEFYELVDKGDYSVDYKGVKVPVKVGVYDFSTNEDAIKCRDALSIFHNNMTECFDTSHHHNLTLITSTPCDCPVLCACISL